MVKPVTYGQIAQGAYAGASLQPTDKGRMAVRGADPEALLLPETSISYLSKKCRSKSWQ